jgi:hypothetical protein
VSQAGVSSRIGLFFNSIDMTFTFPGWRSGDVKCRSRHAAARQFGNNLTIRWTGEVSAVF